MDFSKGYSASYFLSLVDKSTWLDTGDVIEITGGSIRRTLSDMLESATVNCINYQPDKEEWVRIYMTAKQRGSAVRTPLFTGIAAVPNADWSGRLRKNTLNLYSVLLPADDVLLPRGWYAPYYADAPALARDLLKTTGAPIEVAETDNEEKIRLTKAIIAEGGETRLTMARKLVDAIGWLIKIGGDGKIFIEPPTRDESLFIDTLSFDIAESNITVERDWFDCPNVYRAVMNDSFAIAKDEDPDSPYSIQNRGREIWVEETNIVLTENKTLSAFAMERLKELQMVETTVTYDRRFVPGVYPSDIVNLNFPAQGVQGRFVVSSQTIELSGSAKTSEEVKRV